MKDFFLPAISLMNRLKYPQKFALISSLFVLPLSIVSYLLFLEIQNQTDFTQQELIGNSYVKPLRSIWRDANKLQLLLNDTSSEEKQNNIAQFQEKINTNIKALSKLNQQIYTRSSIAQKFDNFQQKWQKIQQNQNSWSFETKNHEYNQIIHDLIEINNEVRDQSNLTLDSDLDTYYLMDATLITIPDMDEFLVEVRLISQKVSQRGKAVPLERARLIYLLGNLKHHEEELIQNLQYAFSNNPTGNLSPKLAEPLKAFSRNIQELDDLARVLFSTNEIPNPQLYYAATEKSLNQSLILWDKINFELDVMLQARLNSLKRKQLLLFTFISISLASIVYLYIGFYQGVMQTVFSLDTASKRMISGHVNDTIALNTPDELGQVVKSFNSIAEALVQSNQALVQSHEEVTILNERLNSENIRIRAELDLTRAVQQLILPKEEELAQIPDLDIAGFMQPASQMGGDYYDIIYHNGQVKIGIGDVTGHGLESGMLMMMVQTAVRTLLENNETDPRKFLETLNRTIYHNVQRMNSDKNMTLCLLDYQNGLVRLSGQHEEMLVIRRGGLVQRVDTIDLGFPIGLEKEIGQFVGYADIQLYPGDVVVLYTDGITEAEDIKGQHYGLKRLTEVVKDNWKLSAGEIKQAVLDDLWQHIGEQKILDDITLVVLKQKKISRETPAPVGG